jgi:hypothetical protein
MPTADDRPPSSFVRVKHPEIEHKVRAQDFENWLAAPAKSPEGILLAPTLGAAGGRMAGVSPRWRMEQ